MSNVYGGLGGGRGPGAWGGSGQARARWAGPAVYPKGGETGHLRSDWGVNVQKVLTLIHKAECEVSQAGSSGEEGSSPRHLGTGLVLSARPCCH